MKELSSKAFICEYTDILLGIRKRFSQGLVLTKQSVADIGRFAFEYLLEWTPEDIKNRLTYDILKNLKLNRLFEEYSDFPRELNSRKDMFYYAHWLYPEVVPYDSANGVLSVYRDVVSGKRSSYSMNFFTDNDALDRAEMCLREALKHISFKNVYDMYLYFYNDTGSAFINQYKLSKPAKAYYNSPLHFLHESLPYEYKDEFWYNYFLFLPQFTKKLNLLKKKPKAGG